MHIGLSLNEIIKIICYFILILFLSFSQNNIKLNIKRVHKPKDIFLHHKVYIEAHRGANKEFFQNTMEAFKKSIQYEADAIETDVWLTKDNELVLLHANSIYGSLTNYYDHEGNVIDLTWAELSTYRTIKDNLTMPRLRDLMEIAKNKIFIDLEIKDQRIDLVFPEPVIAFSSSSVILQPAIDNTAAVAANPNKIFFTIFIVTSPKFFFRAGRRFYFNPGLRLGFFSCV